MKTRWDEHVSSLISDWRDRAHQSDGGAVPPAHGAPMVFSRPHRIYTSLDGCRSERARITGSRRWQRRRCCRITETARSALAELRVPARRHPCVRARAQASGSIPATLKSPCLCNSLFFFFLQLPFKEGSCSHEQLTSGKMLGTLRIRWFGLLRAPHSQLVSWGTWQTGCSHQQCWRHVSGIKSI